MIQCLGRLRVIMYDNHALQCDPKGRIPMSTYLQFRSCEFGLRRFLTHPRSCTRRLVLPRGLSCSFLYHEPNSHFHYTLESKNAFCPSIRMEYKPRVFRAPIAFQPYRLRNRMHCTSPINNLCKARLHTKCSIQLLIMFRDFGGHTRQRSATCPGHGMPKSPALL